MNNQNIAFAKILVWFCLAFLLATGAICFFQFPTWLKLVLVPIAIAVVALAPKNRAAWIIFGILLGLSLGLRQTEKFLQNFEGIFQGDFQGQVVIEKEPEKRSEYQKIVARATKDDAESKNKIKEKVILFLDPNLEFEYGQILEISCQLQEPENNYEKFDYQRFLAKDGIFQICRGAQAQKTKENQGRLLKQKLFSLRRALEQKINRLFPLPESAYLAGLLLGGEGRLPDQTAEAFRRTGTTHVVAVSGSNITIISAFLMQLAIALGFWRRQAFWLSILAIIAFVLMIGAPSSAVRAALMGGLVLWAAKNGRLASSVRAVLFASVIMTWHSPLTLVYDAGFQLSVLATLGIILVYSPLSEKLGIENDFLELKSILLTTVAAQLGVTGLIVYSFESFSPISLLANLIILPPIPLIMASGFGVTLLSFASFPLAKILALPIWFLLHLEIKIVEILSTISWASLEIKGLSWIWLLIYYLLFLILVFHLKHRSD